MNLKDVALALEEYLMPQSFPLAVRMTAPGEALPEKTRLPVRDFKNNLAICQCFNMARRYGWKIAVGREDQSCPIGSVILGFEEAVPYYTEGNLADGMYTQCKEAGALSEQKLGRFPFGQYEYLLMAPLKQADFMPHFLYIYCNPAQLMRLVHAALYVEGGSLTSSFTGRGECAETIVHTMDADRCQVILPGNGERVFGHTQDHEMAFTIPASQIENVVTGLAETHKKGVRYPIPAWLNYEVAYPPKYMKLKKIWRGEEE
jgi:uncharacterized protein (DUF169 family)